MKHGSAIFIHRFFRSDAYEPSGGERKKIALGRSLYKESDFLVWDEPTVSLDTETEKRFLDNIANELQDKTIVFTTHRLGLVHVADLIIVIRVGVVVEQGKHIDLINLDSEYARIYNLQAEKLHKKF